MPDSLPLPDRQVIEADIVCVGFGPATAGFLSTIAPRLVGADGVPMVGSPTTPGLPPQVICFERSDGFGFGVSGVTTRARGIRACWPDLDLGTIPMAAPITHETIAYLLDPVDASQRSAALSVIDAVIRAGQRVRRSHDHAIELPWIPSFLRKEPGFVLSIGQFGQWVADRVMAIGTVQVWPSSPVAAPLVEGNRVVGVRLTDQGTDRQGRPAPGYTPGLEVRAALTVVGDGPVGAVSQRLDEHFGLPPGHHRREWALGVKVVVDLPARATLGPGTVVHTFGFPEPEIFGFLYVHPDRVASLGIFLPSWCASPVRSGYLYLQQWMRHPYLWRHLEGGRLRSWGARSIQEAGRLGEPHLVGDGYARIGEGSGSTNVLTGSGVDEAWTTGVQLGESVLELLAERAPFTRANLARTYLRRRRASRLDEDARMAERARHGFHRGVGWGLLGMAMAAWSRGRIGLRGDRLTPGDRLRGLRRRRRGRVTGDEIGAVMDRCWADGQSAHAELMAHLGWPAVPLDGTLLLSHQDALLVGGKVQAPAGQADHVVFRSREPCQACEVRICVEACSGQAIQPGSDAVPVFDRDRCVHCGACLWNCTAPADSRTGGANVDFGAGSGGLHSSEN